MASIIRRRADVPSYQAYDPFRLLREAFDLEPFRGGSTGETAAWAPHFEVLERKDGYVFRADLPGVAEKDLDITLTENRLVISGKREAEQRNQGETFYAYERTFGSFSRGFSLPDGVDGENVQAELKDGVLSLVVPKKPEVQPKKIEIRPLKIKQ